MTVVEVLVSLGLLGSALAATNLVQGETTSALRAATQRDAANELARATLEEAKAFGCGLATGSEPAARLSAWQQHCWGGLGDASYSKTVGTVTYSVTLLSAWAELDAPNGACAAARPVPDGLERHVTVVWTGHRVSADDFESVPPDAAEYRDSSDGALVTTGSPGLRTTVTVGQTTIARTIGPQGCALWGFLPAGPAPWTVGSRTGTAFVTSGQVTNA